MATLTFNQFIVGPNAGPIIKHYPTSRVVLPVNLGVDITGYTVSADYQTLVVDKVSMDRSNNPNFSDSEVIGTFPLVEILGADVPVITDAATGAVNLIIPADIYSGPLLPGDRVNAPITVISLTWEDTNGFKDSFRQPLQIAYEPDVVVGDPTLEVDYTAKA